MIIIEHVPFHYWVPLVIACAMVVHIVVRRVILFIVKGPPGQVTDGPRSGSRTTTTTDTGKSPAPGSYEVAE